VGIVAERDLLLAAANFGSAEVPVAEIMQGPPICVAEDAELKQAARLLVVKHIGSLPVLGPGKALVGIITETDIFKVAAGMLRARPAPRKTAKKSARKVAKATAKGAAKRGARPAAKKSPSKAGASSRKAARKAT
jgi:CBS-domain-containing membrane protein